MRILIAAALVVSVLAVDVRADSMDSFAFSGTYPDGSTASATMDISIVGSTLTATVENTSPTSFGGSVHAPALTGFGFDLNPDSLGLTSWTLHAKTAAGTAVQIGSNSGSWDWEMDVDGWNGINLDYIPRIQNVDGALYNPGVAGDIGDNTGSSDNYFTTATLVMNFDADPTLVAGPRTTGRDAYSGSPFVRFKGEPDSLKLVGTPGDPVPEPGTFALFGAALGAAWFIRRRRSA